MDIKITTINTIPGFDVSEHLGVVKGNCIRARFFAKDIFAALQTLKGGEVSEYTQMMIESREIAESRMIKKAVELEADAIVGMRFMTSVVMGSAAEMLAYGTAVKLKKN